MIEITQSFSLRTCEIYDAPTVERAADLMDHDLVRGPQAEQSNELARAAEPSGQRHKEGLEGK